MEEPSVHDAKKSRLGVGGWLSIAFLGALLGASIWFMIYGWTLTNAVVSTPGFVALALGVVFSMARGSGLMALLFYSNRKGYDR